MGILDSILGVAQNAQQGVRGLLADPVGTVTQYVNNNNAEAGRNLDALGALYKDVNGRPTFDQSQWSPAAIAANRELTNQLAGAMLGTLAPLKAGPHYAVNDLSEYTPKLYRETNISSANDFLPNNMSQPTTLHFANDPAYALGQGGNRGVMLEFDAKGMPGQLNLSKPTARQAYDSGYAEFLSRDANQQALGANLRSVTVSPSEQSGPYFKRLKNSMAQQGWAATTAEDGSIIFRKP